MRLSSILAGTFLSARRFRLKTIQEFIQDAARSNGPRVSKLVRIRQGGVDPLGLRQINFNLMDQFFPQLNNVARHIRPLTIMAWAWRCAWKCADRAGLEQVPVPMLHDMVDRIEVMFVWSQIIVHGAVDLPGSSYLKARLPASSFTFAGDQWTQMQRERRFSTSLSAAVNYGPSLFNFRFARRGTLRDEVRVHPMAEASLDALESLLEKHRDHPAFTQFGEITVTHDELKQLGSLWGMGQLTDAEREHISAVLGGPTALQKRQHGVSLLKTTAEQVDAISDSTLRSAMCDFSSLIGDSQLWDSVAIWRGIQVRQLFRLALETMLYWMAYQVRDDPRSIAQLARKFLDKMPAESTVADWLIPPSAPETVDILGPLVQLEQSLRGRIDIDGLPGKIHQALRTVLACNATDNKERRDRLPLAQAQNDKKSFDDKSPAEFLHYILSSWVLGQHVLWSVGRGIGDARRGADRILRLKVVPDEMGLRLVPGATNSVPRSTPDRLGTAISLLQEAGELNQPS
jgi:hypothetical protein